MKAPVNAHGSVKALRPPWFGNLQQIPTRLMVSGIRLYQATRAGRPSPCRFLPSCSEYGAEALETHGTVRGSLLIIKRISRCRPGGGSGVDLVPPRSPQTCTRIN